MFPCSAARTLVARRLHWVGDEELNDLRDNILMNVDYFDEVGDININIP